MQLTTYIMTLNNKVRYKMKNNVYKISKVSKKKKNKKLTRNRIRSEKLKRNFSKGIKATSFSKSYGK